jgi:hypothetical protein
MMIPAPPSIYTNGRENPLLFFGLARDPGTTVHIHKWQGKSAAIFWTGAPWAAFHRIPANPHPEGSAAAKAWGQGHRAASDRYEREVTNELLPTVRATPQDEETDAAVKQIMKEIKQAP